VAIDHINDMNHYIAWALPMRELRTTFAHPDTRRLIERYHGAGMNRVLETLINQQAESENIRQRLLPGIDRLRGKFATSVVGLKPTIYAKQVVSFPAFASDIPATAFADGMMDAMMHPVKVMKTLGETAYIKNRYGSGTWTTRDIKAGVIRPSSSIAAGTMGLADQMMFMTRAGDKFAIMVGGWSVYKYHYDLAIKDGKSEKAATAIASEKFGRAANLSQQASAKYTLSMTQTGSQMYRFMTMFQNALQGYYRQIAGAIRHSKDTPAESAKRLAIYWVILPAMFSGISAAPLLSGDEDDIDDYFERMMWSVVFGPANGLVAVKDSVNYLANRWIFGKHYGVQFAPVSDILVEFERLGSAFMKDEISLYDILKASAQLMGYATGIPVEAARNMIEGFLECEFWQMLGFTKGTMPDK